MKNSTHCVLVEFNDRQSGYWEVVSVQRRPGDLLRRLQRLLTMAEGSPSLREHCLAVTITRETIVIDFDSGDLQEAETFATFVAWSIGWKKSHGVVIGRA